MRKRIFASIFMVVACAVGSIAMFLPTSAASVKTWNGSVNSVSSASFKITAQSKKYVVKVVSSTKLTNRLNKKIKLSNVSSTDKIKVTGTAAGFLISAQTVQDTSLPKTKSTSTKP